MRLDETDVRVSDVYLKETKNCKVLECEVINGGQTIEKSRFEGEIAVCRKSSL